jgi:hypothetical protein
MKNKLISPEDSKNIAKSIFSYYHPENEMWFEIAWEVLEENDIPVASENIINRLPGLAAAAEASSEMALMADDLVMIFEAFMTKEPILGADIANRIQDIAQSRSGEAINREKIIKRFSSVLELDNNESSHSLNEIIKEQFAETHELIRSEHIETRHAVKKPIISSKFTYNCLISLFPISREVVINTGFDEIAIKLSSLKFQLFQAIAKLNMESNGWVSWDEIAKEIPVWIRSDDTSNKDSNYIGHRVRELKKLLPDDFSGLIESRQQHGYRISTHPDNMSIFQP